MIKGIGTDIVEIERIKRSLERWGNQFQSKILHQQEIRDLDNIETASTYLARQFAAKEAVVKALGTGINHGVVLSDVVVFREKSGAPFVELRGGAKKQADLQQIESVLVSISQERGYAIAFAIAMAELPANR